MTKMRFEKILTLIVIYLIASTMETFSDDFRSIGDKGLSIASSVVSILAYFHLVNTAFKYGKEEIEKDKGF